MTNRALAGVVLLTQGLLGCAEALPVEPFTVPPAFVVANVTLTGVVSELTSTGPVPIEGVRVFLSDNQDVYTDARGFFSFAPVWVCPCSAQPWLAAGLTVLLVGKDGYEDPVGQPRTRFGYDGPGWRDVSINGDTRVDLALVRR